MPRALSAGYESWRNLARFVLYFFSIGILARTLFSGWRRESSPNYEWWERVILALVFTVVGFIIRLIVIFVGLVVLAFSLILLPVLVIVPLRFSYGRLVKIGSVGKSWAYGYAYALHAFGRPLYRGRDVKLYGREEVVGLITRVLSREAKDNVLLIGAPGAGKETILEQFAKDVYRGLVPEKLRNREVIEIPLADVPVDRLDRMFKEARQAGNIIAVLHEPEKYRGMLETIMPLLSAAELQVIAVTTFENYVGFWKDNADVMRYFERVDVPPLSAAATLEYLADYARERHPNLSLEEGALEEIVRRTDELVQTKTQPEKSVDVLEELAVGAKAVTIADVDHLLSERTGVPLGALERDEKEILLTLEDTLRAEIVGQDEAVRSVASALRRARAGVASRKKPIGSLLFLGPTGVGKTYTAEMLARHYFGGDGMMVRFDMSEFALPQSEPAFVERLTLAIEENPFCLLFLDEIEKADRAVWNTLLQVLDEGRLSTRSGRAVSFVNAIIIATSNAGTAYVEAHPEVTKDALMKVLIEERLFSPEFLNRFDDIVLFHPLSLEEARTVTRLLLAELNERLMKERGVSVEITDSLVENLLAAGFDETNGARALRRAVQDKVENAVANALLREEAKPGSRLVIG